MSLPFSVDYTVLMTSILVTFLFCLFADAGVYGGLKKGSLMIAKMQMRLDFNMIAQVLLYLHPSSELPPTLQI